MNTLWKIYAIAMILTSPLFSQKQDNGAAEKALHPAIQAVTTWAEAYKNGTVTKDQAIFTQIEKEALASMGSKGDFEKEFSNIILSKRATLSFKAENEEGRTGMILSDGRGMLLMKKENEHWVLDAEKIINGVKKRAKESTARQSIASLTTSLDMYKNLAGHYPTEQQGLESLVKKPDSPPRPRRWTQALDNVDSVNDPWGNPYQYKLIEEQPVITSLGPDGKVSEDDISNQ